MCVCVFVYVLPGNRQKRCAQAHVLFHIYTLNATHITHIYIGIELHRMCNYFCLKNGVDHHVSGAVCSFKKKKYI